MPIIRFKGEYSHISLTTPPLKILRPKINKAYFATAKIEEVEVTSTTKKEAEVYTVKSGDTLGKIATKKGVTVNDIIKSDSKITDANKNDIKIGQKITLPTEISATEKKKKITFTKTNTGTIGNDLYVIVETEKFQGYKVSINIKQGKEKCMEEPNKALMLKDDQGNYNTQIITAVGGMKETDFVNKNDFADMAIFKVVIDTIDTDRKKRWTDALEKAKDKKTSLYILADAHSLSGQEEMNINYFGDTEEGEIRGEKVNNRWLDVDGAWFEVKKDCDCGQEYDKQFKCQKYGTAYGPVYFGKEKLANYSGWAELIQNSVLTIEEKEILIGMSENEGNLDSVQSYDSEIFTAGAMQKTVNSQGKGEFPIQVKEFKEKNPDKYKSLFEDCGWTVENSIMYYKDLSDSSSTKITGSSLKSKIREGFKSSENKKKLKCKPLEPIVRAMKDKDFQAKQVEDFIDRLKNKVLPIKPTGYSYKIKDYLKSKLGKATALDHHINRPGYVKTDFGEALDNFFDSKDEEVNKYNKDKEKKDQKEKISRNPNDWGDSHSDYEKEILEDYGKNRRGTDMENRYNKMKSKLS